MNILYSKEMNSHKIENINFVGEEENTKVFNTLCVKFPPEFTFFSPFFDLSEKFMLSRVNNAKTEHQRRADCLSESNEVSKIHNLVWD